MKTSCFRKYKGDKGVSIALYAPDFYKGPEYMLLAPPRDLLFKIKQGKIDNYDYEEIYRKDVLSKLDPLQVFNDLKGKVLLCWENPGEFCHRRLVAEWLQDNLGIDVPEWTEENDKPKENKPLF